MADFVAVLKKTIDGLKDNSPQMREKVYDKARATIEAKLAALNPPPPPAVADRQRQSLETAIDQVRTEYSAPPPPVADPDFEEDFSNFFGDEPDVPRAASTPQDAGDFPSEPYQPVPSRSADEIYDSHAPTSQAGAPSDADDYDERPYSDAYADEGDWQEGDQDDVFLDKAHSDGAGFRGDDDDDDSATATGHPIYAQRASARKKRGPSSGLIAALLVAVVVAGAGYGIWINRDDFGSIFGSAPQTAEPVPVSADSEDVAAAPADATEQADTPVAAAEPETEKFTQRLLPDGSEVDEGVAGEEPTIGEGTSVAAVTPPDQAQGATSAPVSGETATDDQPQLAVGQRAIFYEERTADAEGSAETGTILWSLVQESPGGDLPPEPAIRAEVTIPSRDLQLRMTIRRNGDQSLPASHIVEMIFLTPDSFAGGTIDNVLRVAMKESEQAAGNPLIGIPAKIADGFFLVALSDSSAEVEANTTLLRRQSWIDVPITYGSGRRALMTMEKGIPGDRVFEEALRAWSERAPIADEAAPAQELQ